MASNPTTEIPVDAVVDGKEIFALFNQVEGRIKQIEKLMQGVGLTSVKAAQLFNNEVGSFLRDFNKAAGQIDKFERTMTKASREAATLSNKISGATAGQQVRADASRYGAVSTQSGLQLERELATQKLLNAATAEEKEQALQTLKILERKLRVAEALVRAEESAANRAAKSSERGLASDATPDRTLRLNNLRQELRASTDITALESRREGSALKLNAMLAERNVLSGKERIDQNARIREEIERNKLIDSRILKLRQQQVAEEKANGTGAGGGPPPLFGATGVKGIFARTAAYSGAAALLFTAVNTAQQAAQFTVQFEDALAKLGSIANATAPEMVKLKETILDVGKGSRFSLIELTEMATKLAQAGVSASGMKDALKAVSTLAAASGSTPDESVDLVTAALGAFQLQGKEAARVADVMTSALNRTRLTVQQAALAIQYVGTTAYEQNISLEQLLATAGALSQAGIRSGSTIGTGFRQFLVDLQSPTEKLKAQLERLGITMADVDVKTRGLPAVLETLQQKGFGAAQAYGSLETRAAAFYLVAKNNLPLMNELQMSFADQGAATIAQERAMNSLAAQWQRFKNILADGFQTSADSVLTIAKNLLTQIGDRLLEIRRMAEENKKNPTFLGIGGAVGRAANYDVGPALEGGVERLLNGQFVPGSDASSLWMGGLRPGTWLKDLGKDANDATGKMQQLETAMHEASQASAEQRDTVSALDKEILRLVTQKEALRGKTGQVTAETVTLMARFEGLSQHIRGATGDINGLISALEELKQQETQTLIDRLSEEATALHSRAVDARDTRVIAVRQIKSNGELMKALGPQGRAAVDGLGGVNGRQAAQTLLDAAKKFEVNNNDWAKLLRQAGSAQQSIFSSLGQEKLVNSQIGQYKSASTPFGQQLVHNLTEVTGALDRLRSSSGADRTKQANELTVTIRTTQNAINSKKGKRLSKDDKEFLAAALVELASDSQQMQDILTPSAADGRAADKAAQMISFGSPVAGRPRITSGIGHRASPGGIGSTNHQGIDIAGKAGDPVFAAADGVVSYAGASGGGYGNLIKIDHGMGTETRYAHLSVVDVTVGQIVAKGQKIGRIGMTGNATGPHLHFERRIKGKVDRNPLGGLAPGSQADVTDRSNSLAEQEERRADREATAKARLATSNADADLKEKLKDLKYATTDTVFDAGVTAANSALDVWAQKLRDEATADLDRNDATASERAARMKEVEAQIQQRRDETNQTIYDAVIANFQRIMDALDKAFERALQPNKDLLAAAQARLEGLSRQSLQGKVPDYVQQMAQTRVGQLQERVGRDELAALPGKISNSEAEVEKLRAKLAAMSQTDPQRDNTTKLLADWNDKVHSLNVEYANLRAQFSAGDMIPKTIGEGIRQAVDAYREAHNLTASWTDMINMNLTDAIGGLHQSLEGLLTDLTSGTTSVTQSFKNMAGAIIKYLQQMLVKMMAVKLMQLALSFIPGAAKAPVTNIGGGTQAYFNANPFGGSFHGGLIKGAYRGEHIQDGVSNRDSVLRKLAKGEFVVRKRAVDSVGADFMKQLNERGSAALAGIAPKIVMPPPAEQKMNVYVVAPEQHPTMGPNDVLVTIAQDIYRGGPTKQLIKQVAQGG